MSIIKYKAFVKVAELGSLTKAAEVLGYSQPGISHMISSLEADIGFPLFHRSRDSCTITESGKELLYYCTQIIKNETYLQDTVESLKGLLTGSIRIGSVSSMLINFVPKVIYRFSTTYSNINIQLKERTFEEIQTDLRNGTIDVGFTSDNIHKSFEFIPLLEDPICIILPHGHPFTAYDTIPISILNGCDFIMPAQGFDDVIHIITDKTSFMPNIKYTVGSDIAAIGMVSNNLGVSVMSKRQTQLLADSVIVKDFSEDFHRTLGISLKSLKHSPPALKTFVKIARDTAKK